MAANITDLVSRVTDSNTGRPIIGELASPGKALGAASINLAAATNWTLETAIHFAIYETTTVGNLSVKDTTTQTDWKGTLSGTTIGNLTLTGGTDRAYTAGAIVEITPTARYAKDMYDWAMTGHNQNGTHKAFTESGIVPTVAIQNEAVTHSKIDFDTLTLGYTEITSNFVTTAAAPTLVTGLTLTQTIATGDRIEISGYVPKLSDSTVRNVTLTLWEGAVGTGTIVGQTQYTSGGAGYYAQAEVKRSYYSPSAGSKTYNLSIHQDGAGTATITAAATSPAYLSIKRV